MAFTTIEITGGSRRRQSHMPATTVSDRNDRLYRIFVEGETTNKKVYKESTVLARVNQNLSSHLRTK